MAKNHLKRLAIPRTWDIKRKQDTFVTRPRGYLNEGMPVAVILKDMLGIVSTRAETKRIVQEGKIKIDGAVIKDERLPVVIMSVMEIADHGAYRMLLNLRGKLFLKNENAKAAKPCKITSKTSLAGNKTQLGFHDGRTMVTENKDCKVGDTMVFKLPDLKKGNLVKLDKGTKVYITGGSNVGNTGVVESAGSSITVKIADRIIETGKENVLAIDDSIDVKE